MNFDSIFQLGWILALSVSSLLVFLEILRITKGQKEKKDTIIKLQKALNNKKTI